MQISSA